MRQRLPRPPARENYSFDFKRERFARFHLDVTQAFVQAPLNEERYMRLPPGCCELSGKVMKLLKCQYGLKQAGREWHLLQVTWLVKKIGMEQCKVVR